MEFKYTVIKTEDSYGNPTSNTLIHLNSKMSELSKDYINYIQHTISTLIEVPDCFFKYIVTDYTTACNNKYVMWNNGGLDSANVYMEFEVITSGTIEIKVDNNLNTFEHLFDRIRYLLRK